MYGLVVSAILLLTMLVLGPLRLFYYLPKVAMSGIVLVAASSLFELEQLYFLIKIRVRSRITPVHRSDAPIRRGRKCS